MKFLIDVTLTEGEDGPTDPYDMAEELLDYLASSDLAWMRSVDGCEPVLEQR